MKAKVIHNSDYIRISVIESKDTTITLTWSYSGDKMSASPNIDKNILKRIFKAWSTLRDKKDGMNLGQKMTKVQDIAHTSQTLIIFTKFLEELNG